MLQNKVKNCIAAPDECTEDNLRRREAYLQETLTECRARYKSSFLEITDGNRSDLKEVRRWENKLTFRRNSL